MRTTASGIASTALKHRVDAIASMARRLFVEQRHRRGRRRRVDSRAISTASSCGLMKTPSTSKTDATSPTELHHVLPPLLEGLLHQDRLQSGI